MGWRVGGRIGSLGRLRSFWRPAIRGFLKPDVFVLLSQSQRVKSHLSDLPVNGSVRVIELRKQRAPLRCQSGGPLVRTSGTGKPQGNGNDRNDQEHSHDPGESYRAGFHSLARTLGTTAPLTGRSFDYGLRLLWTCRLELAVDQDFGAPTCRALEFERSGHRIPFIHNPRSTILDLLRDLGVLAVKISARARLGGHAPTSATPEAAMLARARPEFRA